jgi:transcriptional regulator with XRE-family HTH domain
MTTGEKISLIRKANNLNQLEMCNLLGVKQSTLSQIENDKLNISVTSLEVLATKFKISANWLLDNTKSEEEIDLYYYKRRLKVDKEFKNSEWESVEIQSNKEEKLNITKLNNDYSNTVSELEIIYKRLILVKKQILTLLNFFYEKEVSPLNEDEIDNLIQMDNFINNFNFNDIEDEKLKQYLITLKTYLWTGEEYLSTLIYRVKLEIKKPFKNFKELK